LLDISAGTLPGSFFLPAKGNTAMNQQDIARRDLLNQAAIDLFLLSILFDQRQTGFFVNPQDPGRDYGISAGQAMLVGTMTHAFPRIHSI
jgi:hypothetical protein